MREKAFTLAEVLITLGVIGIVAAMTISTLIQNAKDAEFKTAYKKAYSDLSQMFIQNLQEGNWPSRPAQFDAGATASEWAVIQSAFKAVKVCDVNHLTDCWTTGETAWGGPAVGLSNSFIDASGRSWSEYSPWENIYLVDTNGLKAPNKFGKDRWLFTLSNADNSRITTGIPKKIGSLVKIDVTSSPIDTCMYPPCYFKSWLYDN